MFLYNNIKSQINKQNEFLQLQVDSLISKMMNKAPLQSNPHVSQENQFQFSVSLPKIAKVAQANGLVTVSQTKSVYKKRASLFLKPEKVFSKIYQRAKQDLKFMELVPKPSK